VLEFFPRGKGEITRVASERVAFFGNGMLDTVHHLGGLVDVLKD